LYKEIAVTGIVADLAARLESKAKPGQVLVGKDTFFQAQSSVTGIRRRLRLKGAPEPITAYQINISKPFSGIGSKKQVQKTPFVNRNRELSSLKQTAQELLQGRGQTIFLLGDAGIGKSRLLSVFEDAVRSDRRMTKVKIFRIQWNETYQALGQGQLKTLRQPLIVSRMPCRGWMPKNTAQPNSSFRRKKNLIQLEQTLNILLKRVMSTHRSKSGQNALGISVRQMSGALRSISEGSGAIVILENLHWADEESMKCIDRLIEFTSQFPILLLCVCRPGGEYRNWQHLRNLSKKYDDISTRMFIEELSYTDSTQLVQSLLSNQSLLPEAVNDVLKIGRGNPLFLAELVLLVDAGEYDFRKALKSKGRPPLPVPSTVLKITASRISRLKQPTRRILQIASVIGPCFSTVLLSTVADTTTSKLRRVIKELKERRLITQISDKSDENYAFTEPLLHQTVYEGLRLKDRRMIHDRVAQSIRSTDRSKS
jgi:ABC-type lipoprotein export system ATPase subunit